MGAHGVFFGCLNHQSHSWITAGTITIILIVQPTFLISFDSMQKEAGGRVRGGAGLSQCAMCVCYTGSGETL